MKRRQTERSSLYIKMHNLKDFLTGARFVKTEDIMERAKWQYKGILERAHETNDIRSDEKIWEQTFLSVACEIGIADALPNGQLNEQEFDYKDISTWGFDVTALGSRFEIKLQKWTETWYSMTSTIAQTIWDKYTRDGYDYIITASAINKGNGFEIWPRLLINPQTFKNNLSKSKYDNYKPIYYNQYVAQSDGDCQVYNEKIMKMLQNEQKKGLQTA